MLQAGYLEDWEYHDTLSGVPQGGVVSPVLSNIYLHRMDEFVETVLMPEYTRGKRRASSPAYFRVRSAARRARARGDRAQARKLRAQQRGLPSSDPDDPGYRRLRYVRYADDALLGLAGPKAEAEEIKSRLAAFLRDDLRLELNEDKTLLTHARTGAASFLGYEVTVWHSKTRPRVNGTVRLRVPPAVIKAKCAPYFQHGKPERRTGLLNFDDALIISTYGAEYRGIVQYYLLASDVWKLNRLEWAAKVSTRKSCERGTPKPGAAIAGGHAGGGVTGPGFCRSAVAGPRCGGPRGWRSRAGTGRVPRRTGAFRRGGRIRRGRRSGR